MAKPARFTGKQLKYVEGLLKLHGVSGTRRKLAEEGIKVARNTLIDIAKAAGIVSKPGRPPAPAKTVPRNVYAEAFRLLYPDFPTG
jgi:hypothetical protein